MKILSRRLRACIEQEEGVVAVEAAVVISLLAGAFIGILTATGQIDMRASAQNAASDIALTVRATGGIDEREEAELATLFEQIAADSLESSTATASVSVEKLCGCPLEGTRSRLICELPVCGDGLTPARYLEIALLVEDPSLAIGLSTVNPPVSIPMVVEY
jgi:Flp pilus assembly protein TadG